MDSILVSICCITYNHAPYIRQCLNGFLMQKVSFKYEIIINDDCSTDGTIDIIKDYVSKYPDVFSPIYHNENQYRKGVSGMFINFCFPKARGKYIALCEGDDYWIDDRKLQKQFDWMENHRDYSMSSCDGIINRNGDILDWKRYGTDSDIPPYDMIKGGGGFVLTASLFFRSDILTNYPIFCKQCYVGDYPLQVWASVVGKVRYFSEKMVVYRLFHTGSWTCNVKNINYQKTISNKKTTINMLLGIDSFSQFKYHRHIEYMLMKMIEHLILRYPQFIGNIKNEMQPFINRFSFFNKFIIMFYNKFFVGLYFSIKKSIKFIIRKR